MSRESPPTTMTGTISQLLYVVLLMVLLQGTVAKDSICARDPELQVLDESIHRFDCEVNETVHALNCSHRGIPALPTTSDTAVPVGIEIFDFSYNRIRCLPKINNTRASCSTTDCHAGCVLELHLQHNEIEYLHEDVFLNLTCMNYLDLSHNSITNETLKGNHFYGKTSLRHLDLHGNPLHTLPDNVLISTHMHHLQTLNLSSCQLERIGEAALDNYFEMEVLDLSNNLLSKLPSRAFQGWVSARILDLRWNRLEVIDKDTFGDMRELRELRLDHNNLVAISDHAFHRWGALDQLGLSQNMFTTIPFKALAAAKKLRWLDLSNNPIEVLQPDQVNTSVQELRMDHLSSLREVEEDAFSAFPLLSKLSLRFCARLKTLPAHAFRGSSAHLREVELDHGTLQYLPVELLPWRQLTLLTLHGNDWHCDCRLAWAAGHAPGNSTISCAHPAKLRGQTLQSLLASEMTCPVSLEGAQVLIALSLTSFCLAVLSLLLCGKRRRMCCWCLRGDQGRYVTVFTKDKGDLDEDEDMANGTCGDGEVDDLDLGNGEEGGSSGEGRVMILVKSFRNGYTRLKSKGGESSQDLTSACDV